MSVTQIRKPIHDRLITDFKALKHPDGNTCFADVAKAYIDFPDTTPSCQIVKTEPNILEQNLRYDQKALGFTAIVSDLMESNDTQANLDMKIDRLSDIEDSIYEYLEKIPNSLEDAIPGTRIMRIDISSPAYDYAPSENGVRIYLGIGFSVVILVDTHTLG